MYTLLNTTTGMLTYTLTYRKCVKVAIIQNFFNKFSVSDSQDIFDTTDVSGENARLCVVRKL